MPRNKLTERREFFQRREATRVDTALAKKRKEIQKARAAALKKKPKPKPEKWYERINPFRKLTPILGNKKEE